MYSILLLEDDLLFASSIEDFLVCEGFCVDIAKDGEEVFDFTFHKNYDLYIFDINVPKINGLKTANNLYLGFFCQVISYFKGIGLCT